MLPGAVEPPRVPIKSMELRLDNYRKNQGLVNNNQGNQGDDEQPSLNVAYLNRNLHT